MTLYSILKKKVEIIFCHIVREVAANDERMTAYVNTLDNPANLFTKGIPMIEKQQGSVGMLQHHTLGSFPEASAVA